METKLKHYHLYACLPFIELAYEASVHLGPVLFWPASRYKDFLPPDLHQSFRDYLESIGQVKTQLQMESEEWVQTVQISPHGTTCVSIFEDIPTEQREILLVDSLYLLYFACTFRNMYYGNEIPSFKAFSKVIPASPDFIQNPKNWKNLHINEIDRENTICVHLFDHKISKGLGRTLFHIYQTPEHTEPEKLEKYKRLVRSIRYLIDRFFHQFVNVVGHGLDFPENIFEPEDIIFLASGYEALFNIHDQQAVADFKQKVRPLLHLKYSKPLELFWKWADDFYTVRKQVVHGGETPDPMFRFNPNFEVSHIVIGIKLFVYSVYYMLFKYQMLPSETKNPHTPPDFEWIHPEELLLFFWTEPSLLRKLLFFLIQIKETGHPEHADDIHFLANTFIDMQEHYNNPLPPSGVRFIPTPVKELREDGQAILDIIHQAEVEDWTMILKALPPEFDLYLKKRLSV